MRVLTSVLTVNGIRSVTTELPQSPINTSQLMSSTHKSGFSGPRQEMHSVKGRVEVRRGHRRLVRKSLKRWGTK